MHRAKTTRYNAFALREWYDCLTKYLESAGYTRIPSDPCVYILKKQVNGKVLFVCFWVDDFLIAGNRELVDKFKADMKSKFKMKDLGATRQFLGMEVYRNRESRTIHLTQKVYIKELLSRFNCMDIAGKMTPHIFGQDLSVKHLELPGPVEQERLKLIPYSEAVGSLLHLAGFTRPDISAAVGPLCSYVQNPRLIHWAAVKRILSYLQATSNHGILLGGLNASQHPIILQAYADADWAAHIDTRRSRTGYITQLNGSTIGYRTELQPTVALSSTESEYQSACASIREIMWQRQLLDGLSQKQTGATILFEDNQGCSNI